MESVTHLPLIACIRRAQTAECGRGKPILISILACLLGVHAITIERNNNNTQVATIALGPYTTHPEQWGGCSSCVATLPNHGPLS